MKDAELTADQIKLLYLISKKSRVKKGNEGITWLKELALLTLVYEGIKSDVFDGYDYAPSLVVFHGVKLYANVSQEYLKDIENLRHMEMLHKLKLNTKYYDNINAFAVTPATKTVLSGMSKEMKKGVDALLRCPECGTNLKVRVKVQSSVLICPKCGYERKTGFFKLDTINYKSAAYFSGGGR